MVLVGVLMFACWGMLGYIGWEILSEVPMLGMDDLGGLLYQERFPTVSETAQRIEAFREFRNDENEWEALCMEAWSYSCKNAWPLKEWQNIKKHDIHDQGLFKQHVGKWFVGLVSFKNLFNKKHKQQKQDHVLAMYLLTQFWLGWDKQTLERAYYTYKDPQTRQLLVWFMRQEIQKTQHAPFVGQHEKALDCGFMVYEKLKDIGERISSH